MSTALLVAAGGALGATLRYLTDRLVQRLHDTVFPWGTFTVNAVGSLVLGLLVTAAGSGALGTALLALLGTGLCGALTTYSTFSFETIRLAEDGARFVATVNVVATVATTIGAATAGRAVALWLWGDAG
ncbi:MAG: fluoride efflux transporter CrcB [Actinomycetes bacterium]